MEKDSVEEYLYAFYVHVYYLNVNSWTEDTLRETYHDFESNGYRPNSHYLVWSQYYSVNPQDIIQHKIKQIVQLGDTQLNKYIYVDVFIPAACKQGIAHNVKIKKRRK